MALPSQRTVYASGPIAGIRSYRNGRGTPQDHLKQQRELFTRDQSLFSYPTTYLFLGTADITVTFEHHSMRDRGATMTRTRCPLTMSSMVNHTPFAQLTQEKRLSFVTFEVIAISSLPKRGFASKLSQYEPPTEAPYYSVAT
jgi:hypothetical protein